MKDFIKTLAAAVVSIAAAIGWIIGVVCFSIVLGSDYSSIEVVAYGFVFEPWALRLSGFVYFTFTSFAMIIMLLSWIGKMNRRGITFTLEVSGRK